MRPTPTPEMIEAAERAIDALDYATMPVGDIHREIARAAISAALSVPAAPVVGEPDGWKLVPIEPTHEILMALSDNRYDVEPGGKANWTFEWNAILAAAPSAPDGWQSIETAPKDGTRVLLWTTTRNPEDQQYVDDVLDGEHIEEGQIGYFSGQEWVCERIGHPSHWRKLPAPPALGGKP